MKNLILRANILDGNVNIQHRVLPLPLIDNVVEVIISPKQGYVITSDKLSHGSLPSQITSIDFYQSGVNVIASIVISKFINNNVPQNVSLPLIALSRLNVDNLLLVDKTLKQNPKVITTSMSPYLKSKVELGDSYSVSCAPGETKLLLSKTITTINKHYFSSEPNYIITGNSDRYTVREDVSRDPKGRITRKKLNVYYNSPVNLDETNNEDIIEFNYKVSLKPYGRRAAAATKKEEYEIYSFDEGRKIGTEGGTKVMTVRGLPGTEFKIIVQDKTNKTYNFTTGVFEAGGGMLLGVVPPVVGDIGYGEKKVFVKIPRSSTVNTYKTTFTTDKPLDHVALQQAIVDARESTDSTSTAVSTSGSSAIRQVDVTPRQIAAREAQETTAYTTLDFKFLSTGFSASIRYEPLPDGLRQSEDGYENIRTISSAAGSSSGTISFEATIISTDDSKFIEVERQPRSDIEAPYVAWDSGNNKEAGVTSGGVEILNDWNISEEHSRGGARFRPVGIRAQGFGLSRVISEATAFPIVKIKGGIEGIQHGQLNAEVSLNLLNILTLHSL